MIGFQPDEILTNEATRAARLKWVIVVASDAAAGLQANAVACVSAATAIGVTGLLGPGGPDADGLVHAGLPWAGCTVLAASADQLGALIARAGERKDLFLADMPGVAQTNRIYDDYLAELSTVPTAESAPLAASILGPRSVVERMVKRLDLL